jgi:hypothetical protein
LAGSIRFAIEFIRVNGRIFGPLTLAQLISASLIVTGIPMYGEALRVTTIRSRPTARLDGTEQLTLRGGYSKRTPRAQDAAFGCVRSGGVAA